MPISEFDRAHIGDIIAGNGDWFTAELLRLFHKADRENFAKLESVFPDEVRAYLDWLARPMPPPREVSAA